MKVYKWCLTLQCSSWKRARLWVMNGYRLSTWWILQAHACLSSHMWHVCIANSAGRSCKTKTCWAWFGLEYQCACSCKKQKRKKPSCKTKTCWTWFGLEYKFCQGVLPRAALSHWKHHWRHRRLNNVIERVKGHHGMTFSKMHSDKVDNHVKFSLIGGPAHDKV